MAGRTYSSAAVLGVSKAGYQHVGGVSRESWQSDSTSVIPDGSLSDPSSKPKPKSADQATAWKLRTEQVLVQETTVQHLLPTIVWEKQFLGSAMI